MDYCNDVGIVIIATLVSFVILPHSDSQLSCLSSGESQVGS